MRSLPGIMLIFLTLILGACGNKFEKKKTDDIIPREKMIGIMYDMGLSEAAYRGRLHSDTLATEKVRQRVQFTFKTHDVTEEQFLNSYDYYLSHPEQMSDILNEVLARYSTKSAQVEEEVD